jgi:hypothetical protein
VQGEMGPSVRSVVTSRAQIDGAYDPVMEGHGWRRMQYVIDVWISLSTSGWFADPGIHLRNSGPISLFVSKEFQCMMITANRSRAICLQRKCAHALSRF